MKEEAKKHQGQKPETKINGQQEIDIKKGSINEGLEHGSSKPQSWRPIVDTTESNPPSEGSAVSSNNTDTEK